MLWWISFFNYADRQAIFSIIPVLQEEMGFSNEEKGLLMSAFAWVYGLCAPLAGSLVDRVQRKTAILGGLHVWSLICLATASSQKFFHLVVFRAAEGLGETFYYPASVSMISDYHGHATRSRALGFHQSSVYVGTIAGSYFAALIAVYFGWRWSFIVFGGLGVGLGLVLHQFLHEPRRGASDNAPPAPRIPLLQVLKLIAQNPVVVYLMLAFLCANFVAMVLLSWMPSFLSSKFDLGLPASGLTATVFPQLASMIGSPLGGWLADVLRHRTSSGRIMVQAVGVLGGAPFVFWTGQTESVAALMAFLAAWGLFKGIYDANIFASVFDSIPVEARGSVAGFMNLVGWLGGGSAPLVIAYLNSSYGLSWAISSAAFVYLAAGTFLLAGAFQMR
jgi:MFS family permease